MTLFDSVSNVLKRYSGGANQNPAEASEHFDQVAQAIPPGIMAEGLSSAFRSEETPAFGSLISNLFSRSNGEQKAGLLNHLLGSLGPGALSQITGGGALAGQLGGTNEITAQQAQNVPPEVVERMASHAEKTDPSIVDRASAFYAQHPTLVKTLGGAALSIVLAKVAERQRAA